MDILTDDYHIFWVLQSPRDNRQAQTATELAETPEQAVKLAFGVDVVTCGQGAVNGEYVTQGGSVNGYQYWQVRV